MSRWRDGLYYIYILYISGYKINVDLCCVSSVTYVCFKVKFASSHLPSVTIRRLWKNANKIMVFLYQLFL